MIGAGTIISPIIKVVTTVAILAAAYFFIVKPTLDTTERVSNNAFESVGGLNESVFNDVSPSVQKSIRQAERLQEKAAQASQTQIQDASKLLGCINRAGQNVGKITACHEQFSP